MDADTSPPISVADPPGVDTPHELVELPELASLADVADVDLLQACRVDELDRRRVEGLLIHRMVEIERRRLYAADGFTCLAGWGRGVHRWSDIEARSRRNLTKLVVVAPQVLHRLITGRLGVAQAHLLGRLFKTPRVGQFVVLFIDDFLDQAAQLSYADFEQHLRNWRLLVDQDGPDPERAHRQRGASLQFSDHEFRLVMNGPAIDGAKFKALLKRFEQLEWDLDWAATKQEWGDDARPDLMRRSSQQRRYDAFVNLLAHVDLPRSTPSSDNADDGADGADGADDVELDLFGDASASAPGVTEATSSHRPSRSADGVVGTVVNIMIDINTMIHGLDELFGGAMYRRTSPPFGPRKAFSQTLDGEFISPTDAALTALYGKIRVVATDDAGIPVKMSKTGRLFTGPMRDAVLMLAPRCTHAGCLRGITDCHVDHLVAHSAGGATAVDNGGGACSHHNNWRYTSGARTRLQPNGRWSTHRADGTEIAPPD